MDPLRNSPTTRSLGTSSSSTARPRPLSRRPGLALAGLCVIGAGVGFNIVAAKMRENELAQKKSEASNFYVSVDRSGGGI
ncbi:hypothetical protein B0H67DRAFT_645506 [Lasiosphaeris hirsuta]|uniref:Uncharacterized protein n=1 Tax=Lasiosphaeris hirsuta TaxID=260670 RepID=A0AA40AHB3_9PEZI|nr:hypothetical protein B0H67DRAFT_645506 [Lasiosphaeris hirsuta]